MIAHQQKKFGDQALKTFRDRFNIPVSDEEIAKVPFLKLSEDSPQMKYLRERRAALGGFLPARRRKSEPLQIPELVAFDALLKATAEGREISRPPWRSCAHPDDALLRDKNIGQRIVPIVPDESRTFGMEGLFRQFGIFSQEGQRYRPQDADQLMYYREDAKGQILQEGINEPGAMASFIAAATSYSTSNAPMIPFYIYYSMFGFQRVGDLCWAAGDMRARGFLIGGTSGRTTLNGEGLQHEDGHSHILASTIPNCIGYDPTYAYELAVIIQRGLKRMYVDNQDAYYYITTLNENYPHPAMPEGAEEGILRGMYMLRKVEATPTRPMRVRLMELEVILPRSRGGGRSSRQGLWRLQRNLERHQLHAIASRRARGRALEPAPSRRDAEEVLCRAMPRQGLGAGDRLDRLHQAGRRRGEVNAVPARVPQDAPAPMASAALDYRRSALRAFLRGRPAPCRAGGAEIAGRRSEVAVEDGRRGDQALRHRSRARQVPR